MKHYIKANSNSQVKARSRAIAIKLIDLLRDEDGDDLDINDSQSLSLTYSGSIVLNTYDRTGDYSEKFNKAEFIDLIYNNAISGNDDENTEYFLSTIEDRIENDYGYFDMYLYN